MCSVVSSVYEKSVQVEEQSLCETIFARHWATPHHESHKILDINKHMAQFQLNTANLPRQNPKPHQTDLHGQTIVS